LAFITVAQHIEARSSTASFLYNSCAAKAVASR
jgi:hypothetical protein